METLGNARPTLSLAGCFCKSEYELKEQSVCNVLVPRRITEKVGSKYGSKKSRRLDEVENCRVEGFAATSRSCVNKSTMVNLCAGTSASTGTMSVDECGVSTLRMELAAFLFL